MKHCPCKECTERTLGCHSVCVRFKVAKETWDATKDKQRAASRVNADIAGVNLASLRRNRQKLYTR